jgi:hypothetical protein
VQDFWYADHLDLIKWGILLRLADSFCAKRVLQLAFNPRTKEFDRLDIDGENRDIPPEVIAHFRNLQKIGGLSTRVRVTVFDLAFNKKPRHSYLNMARAFVSAFSEERCIVFLDPDTGLALKKPTRRHVLDKEARGIWEAMKPGHVFAFYQHKTIRGGQEWIPRMRKQLAKALHVETEDVKIARASKTAKGGLIAPRAVIFYTQRRDLTVPGEAAAQPTVVSVPRSPKLKREKLLKPCADDCGGMVGSKFRQGHDAKYKSMVLKVERGEMKIEELPTLMRQQLKWETTENGLKCLNPIMKIHK